jgi:hypothetical protein
MGQTHRTRRPKLVPESELTGVCYLGGLTADAL